MKYLKYFESEAAYTAYKNGSDYILPNVSYAANNNVIYYNPYAEAKSGIIMARYNATEENMLALADTSNVKSLKVNGENIVFDPVQIINKSFEVIGSNIVVNEDGTGEYPDEYMHFLSEGTPIKITIKLKDDSLNIADFNCISFLGKYGGENVKRCNIILIEEAINRGLLSFDETNNALIVNPQFNDFTAVGFVLGNVDTEQEMWVPVFVDTVNEMEIQTGGMPDMYYFNEVGEYDVEIELIDPTLINGTRYDETGYQISNSMFTDTLNNWVSACLTSVIIPDSVTTIGVDAFACCSGLTEVHIGSGVTSIGEDAFGSCSGLTSIVIPDSVIEIVGSAFYDCPGLTSIVIPDSVTSIGSSAFENCSSLISVHIGSGVTSIEFNAFRNCSGLTSINIPDSIIEIENYAFSDCSSLTSVHIGSGVTSIGYKAFENCSSLNEITCLASTAPTIDTYTFKGVAQENGILKVPTGSDYSSWMSTGEYYLGYYNWTIEYIIPENAKILEIPYDEEGNARQTEKLFNLVYANLGEENVKNNVYANTSISVKEATGYDYIRYTRDPEYIEVFVEIIGINAYSDRISIVFSNNIYSYHFSNNSYETLQVPI